MAKGSKSPRHPRKRVWANSATVQTSATRKGTGGKRKRGSSPLRVTPAIAREATITREVLDKAIDADPNVVLLGTKTGRGKLLTYRRKEES